MRPARRLGAALAVLTALPALADTPPDAEAVRAALAPYLGQTLTKAMTLTPEGPGLRMAFGTAPVKVPFLGKLASFTLQPYDQLLTPNPDGTWLVTSDSPVAALLSAPGSEFAVRMKSAAFQGTYDPKIMGFVSSHMTVEGMEQGDKNSDPSVGNSLTTTARSVIDQTAKPGSAPGLIDVSGSSVDTDFAQSSRKGFGSTAITVPSLSSRYSVTNLRQVSILDLWQWLVAHPAPKDWAKDPDEMRRLVRAALPLYDNMQASGGADRAKIVTMLGTVGLDRVAYEFQCSGISPEAAMSQEITIAGLTLPSVVPDWVNPMVPTYARVKISAADLPLAGLADELLASYNPGPIRAFERGLPERIKTIFLADPRHFTLDSLRLHGPEFDVFASGRLTLSRSGLPVYIVTIEAFGLRKIQSQLKLSKEPAARRMAEFLTRALSLAAAEEGGKTVWRMHGSDLSTIYVNGYKVD